MTDLICTCGHAEDEHAGGITLSCDRFGCSCQEWERKRPQTYLDIVFDGPPGPEAGRFVEVERGGASVSVGEWIEQDGYWRLRLGRESFND